jgi:type II secretory pathway component PulJ
MNRVKQYQAGASLMEVLIAMSISLVVTASMIALMANSLSTTARIVKMTKLADDLRVTMQMMTRDVRRSSYNAQSYLCYANDNCGGDGSALTLASAIDFVDTNDDGLDDDNCFSFLMDRNHDGNSTEDDAGGFRRVTHPVLGVDVIEMWTGGAPEPDSSICSSDAGWVQITDPEVVEITEFSINDDLSYTEVIQTDAAGNPTLSQVVRKFRINLQGQLVLDDDIKRNVQDVISVRNDILL